MNQLRICIFVAVFLAIPRVNAYAQIDVLWTKKADMHWKKLAGILESVYSGQFELNFSLDDRKGEVSVVKGVLDFDFRNGNAKFEQSVPRNNALWIRNSDHEIVSLPRSSGIGVVNLFELKSRNVVENAKSPFDDFRILPDLVMANMLLHAPFELRPDFFTGQRCKILSFESINDLDVVTVAIQPAKATLDLMLDELPQELREQVGDLKSKGVLIPTQSSRITYSFKSAEPGLLVRKTFFTVNGDDKLFEVSDHQVFWEYNNGCLVPTEVIGKFGRGDLHITLRWKTLNCEFRNGYFSVDGQERLKGFELFDTRFPGGESLGLVGAPRLEVGRNRNGLLLVFLLVLGTGAFALAIRFKRRSR